MFEIKRDHNTIKIVLNYNIPYGTSWESSFSSTYDNQHYAELVFAQLRDAIANRFETVRQEAYEQGWKDKSAKRTKCTWFSSVI